ncbi:NAD(P)-binding protein [bacterium]|nr:NAD(P)-binding protein [bacterium]
MDSKVCVVGAGLVGSMLATRLAQRGFQVDLYERRVDLRKHDISAGKSINLALSDRGLRALEMVGAAEAMRKISIPMHGRYLHDMEGNTKIMPYGKEGQFINSISRGDLNIHLLNLAEATGNVNLYFNMPCVDVDLDTATITFKDESTGDLVTKTYDRIFGTDGAFSVGRGKMMKTDRFNYSQYYITSGYKELSMPPVPNTKWAIDKNHLHIWPRKSFMLIALPNLDGSFTCTLFLPFEGETAFEHLNSDDKVLDFFNTYFKDAVPHMSTLLEDWHANATSSLVTVKSEPWNYKDKILLMGDAAHAIVPFYGQGMNAGFEDVRVFNDYLDKFNNWDALFAEYSKERVPDGQAIADLAINNYTEMRDLVADPHFVKKRALSARISDLMHDKWLPLYTMVTFSHIRYSEALSKGKYQDEVLEKLVAQNISADSSDKEIMDAVKPFV